MYPCNWLKQGKNPDSCIQTAYIGLIAVSLYLLQIGAAVGICCSNRVRHSWCSVAKCYPISSICYTILEMCSNFMSYIYIQMHVNIKKHVIFHFLLVIKNVLCRTVCSKQLLQQKLQCNATSKHLPTCGNHSSTASHGTSNLW